MKNTTSKTHNTLRALVVASEAARITPAAGTLFEAGGKHLLGEAARESVRDGIRELTGQALTELAGTEAARQLTVHAGRAVARPATTTIGATAARLAAREVARGLGRATVIGAALDGVVGTGEAAWRYSRGQFSAAQAMRHVAREAGTGAAAAAAGTGAVAALVVATGPVGWVTTLAVAGGVSAVTKLGLLQATG